MRVLVVGATGVAGGAGIAAVREVFGYSADITALWFGKEDTGEQVAGADHTLFGDITDPAVCDQVEATVGKSFDWCLYATALGDVGFPVSEATDEQIAASNRLSFDPLSMLEARFEIGAIVAYSTFYNLDHQKITYGAMGHSKAAIENWSLSNGKSRHCCIRAGAFKSASSQGIKLLVRRRAKQLAQAQDPLLRSFFEGVKPSEAVERLETAVFAEEREKFGDSGTDADGLKEAHIHLFKTGTDAFVNVSGQKIWESDDAQIID